MSILASLFSGELLRLAFLGLGALLLLSVGQFRLDRYPCLERGLRRPLDEMDRIKVWDEATVAQEMDQRMAFLAERMEIIQLFRAKPLVGFVVEMKSGLRAADADPRAMPAVAISGLAPMFRAQVFAVVASVARQRFG